MFFYKRKRNAEECKLCKACESRNPFFLQDVPQRDAEEPKQIVHVLRVACPPKVGHSTAKFPKVHTRKERETWWQSPFNAREEPCK